MALTIRADDGDELSVHTQQLCEELIIVRLELHNNSYVDEGDFDWITLTPQQAHALGRALMSAAETIAPDQPQFIPAAIKN
jgi:hypothetical protein